MNNKFSCLLLLFIFCISLSLRANSNSQQVHLVIDGWNDDTWNRNAEVINNGVLKKRIRNAYGPNGKYVSLTPANVSELSNNLGSVVNSSSCVKTLFIAGHGVVNDDPNQNKRLEIITIRMGNELLDMYIMKNLDGSIHHITFFANEIKVGNPFEALNGNFCEDAKIVFQNCSIMNGSEEQRQAKFKGLTKILGIEDGQIYANESDSSNNVDLYFKQHPWEQPTLKAKLISWVSFIGWPVSAPIFCADDYLFSNKGYFYNVAEDRMVPGKFRNAEKWEFPE